MSIEVKNIYCSSACNNKPNTVDWGKNNILCYGASRVVHLIPHENSTGLLKPQTLLGHTAVITSVHWINKPDHTPEDELLVTSLDATATLWKSNGSEFRLTATLKEHPSSVRNGCGMYLNDKKEDLMLVTVPVCSSVKVWTRENDQVSCTQTINMGNEFAIDVKLSLLNTKNEIALLLTDSASNLQIYVQGANNQFVPGVTLKGHEDWIHSIAVLKEKDDGMTIATASQDSYIRLWKVLTHVPEFENFKEEKSIGLTVDRSTFQTLSGETYYVSLESVLSGHEHWVYSVQWSPSSLNEGSSLQLLSASMDKTIIIWELDRNSNIWLEKVRFGEVGGNTLGFLGAVFSPSGESVLAHGHRGAIHMWNFQKEEDVWVPGLTFGGHSEPVKDIAWDPDGKYLMSCSSDQTTRLHAPFINGTTQNSWYEIARPQVHGYDMVCLTVLDRFKFVSAGDEKVLRVFQAPRSFAESLQCISKLDTTLYLKNDVAEGASLPSLGLSNKAVVISDQQPTERHPKDKFPDFYYTPTNITVPPTEETLVQNTLWPESQKLYGHPYEVYSVCSNHSRTLVASACKGNQQEHAGIILWSTSTWKQLSYLTHHSLTVTQMEFSPDDAFLLSVSRDRTWVLCRHAPQDPSLYIKIASLGRKNDVHTRVIWSCAWTFDSLYFATSSRDKKVAVWGPGEQGADHFAVRSRPLEVEDSATAVSFAPSFISNSYLMAIGLENGTIILSLWCEKNGWSILQQLDKTIAHCMYVNRLRFSPVVGEAGCTKDTSGVLQLASCSEDHHTNIYNVYVLNTPL